MSVHKQPDLSLPEFQELMLPYGEDYENYEAAERVKQHIHEVELLLAVGPAGVGKDTILGLTGIWKVTSDTTRSERENDGVMEIHGVHYWFRERRDAHKDILQQNYVQIAPGPTGELYGSRDSAYPDSGIAVMDVVANTVSTMRALPFKSVRSAFFVAPPELYIARLDGRGVLPPEDRRKRLIEGDSSLGLGLDDADMAFVENVQGEQDLAVAHVLEIAHHGHYDSKLEKHARNVGYAMLRGIRQELGLPLISPLSS